MADCEKCKVCGSNCAFCIHKSVCGKKTMPGEFCSDFISCESVNNGTNAVLLLGRLRIQCTKSAAYLFDEHPELLTIDIDDAAYLSYIKGRYKDIKEKRKSLLRIMKEMGGSDG